MPAFFHTFLCVFVCFFSYICMRVFFMHLYAFFFHKFVCVFFVVHLYACLYACFFHIFLCLHLGRPWCSGECGCPITRGLAVQSPLTAQKKRIGGLTVGGVAVHLLVIHLYACFFSYIGMPVFFHTFLCVFVCVFSYICMRVFFMHLYAGFFHTFVCVFLSYICIRVFLIQVYVCFMAQR